MLSFNDCESQVYDKRLVLTEKKSKITFINEKKLKIRKILIEDCVIKKGKRCDYLLIIPEGEEYYIELKGSDILYGIEQIEETIIIVSSDKNNISKKCFVISTRCPPSITATIQNNKVKFKNKYKAQLIVKNSPYEHKIS